MQRLRALAEVPLEVEFRVPVPIPVYQRIAAQAAEMCAAGAAFHAIAAQAAKVHAAGGPFNAIGGQCIVPRNFN